MKETVKDKMNHLDEMTCLLYLERQLDRARGLEVSAHTQECERCRTLLRALERESRLLTRAMLEEDEPLPSRLAQFQERARQSMQWIWGLTFGLAATGVYALYTGYIQPWQQQLEQAGFSGTNLLGLLVFQGAFWKGWQSMITLLEILALATLGGLSVMFLRRRIRRGSALALVFAGLCAALALPGTAAGSEIRKGESVGVSQEETINGDIFLFGDRVRIDGTVKGDVFLFGHDATVSGHVEGDVFGFAQQLQVSGQVDGNIRVFTNTLTIRGNVGKNVLTFDERVDFEPAAKVGGSMTIFVENLSLDGTLGRDLLIFAKHLSVSGKVRGGIQMKGSALTINAGAEVDGPIRYEGDNPPEVSTQAKLASPVEFHHLEHKPRYMQGHYYVWRVIWTGAFILFGMVLVLLMPRFGEETLRAAELYAAPIGLGVLVLFGVPIAAIIACITVVGIPLGVLTLGFWFLMLCCAELVVGAVVGGWILGPSRDTWGLIGRMALGFVIVRIVYTFMEQVHVLALLGALGIWTWGIGAISLAIYRRFQPVLAPGVPSAPSAPPMPPNTTVGGTLPA
jgi:cytoskeletal protein CcmA (bactofilin family)/predicted anti-sigma-YlaC factor YlaD